MKKVLNTKEYKSFIENFKQRILEYKDSLKLAPLVREISWTKNVVIVEKCKDDLQREFYIKMTKKYGYKKCNLKSD